MQEIGARQQSHCSRRTDDPNTDISQVQSGQSAKLVTRLLAVRKLTIHSLQLLHGMVTALLPFYLRMRQIPVSCDHYCYHGLLWNTARSKPLSKRRRQNSVRLSSGVGIKGMFRRSNNNSENPVKTAITKIKSLGDGKHVNLV